MPCNLQCRRGSTTHCQLSCSFFCHFITTTRSAANKASIEHLVTWVQACLNHWHHYEYCSWRVRIALSDPRKRTGFVQEISYRSSNRLGRQGRRLKFCLVPFTQLALRLEALHYPPTSPKRHSDSPAERHCRFKSSILNVKRRNEGAKERRRQRMRE